MPIKLTPTITLWLVLMTGALAMLALSILTSPSGIALTGFWGTDLQGAQERVDDAQWVPLSTGAKAGIVFWCLLLVMQIVVWRQRDK